MLRTRGLRQFAICAITICVVGTAATSYGGVIRSNYYHGSMCQGPSSDLVLYSANGVRAKIPIPSPPPPVPPVIALVCPAPWSVDTPTGGTSPVLRTFRYEVYWTTSILPAPVCTIVINGVTNGLTLVGSPRTTYDPTLPTPNTASSGTQTFPTGIVSDIRRAYMQCVGVLNTAGIDGYTLNTCVGTTLDCNQPEN
jgi:hypothetical protein